jgi:hypothetical protein
VRRSLEYLKEKRAVEGKVAEAAAAQAKAQHSADAIAAQLAGLQTELEKAAREQHHHKDHLAHHVALLRWADSLAREMTLQSLFQRISFYARDLLRCEHAVLFLLDHEKQEFWTRVGEGGANPVRVSATLSGVLGLVVKAGKPLRLALPHITFTSLAYAKRSPLMRLVRRIKDAHKDPRYNEDMNELLGFVARSLACAPVRDHRGDIIGVFQASCRGSRRSLLQKRRLIGDINSRGQQR